MVNLRYYQQQAVEWINTALPQSPNRSVCYSAHTGTGKSVVFSECARQARKSGLRVAVIVHRRELVRQAVSNLRRADSESPLGIVASNLNDLRDPTAPLQVCMIQTLHARKGAGLVNENAPDLVLWDEVHHAAARTWQSVKHLWDNAWHVGFTATPERLDGLSLRELFYILIYGPSFRKMIDEGFLAKPRVIVPDDITTIDTTNVGQSKQSGEFLQSELSELVNDDIVCGAVDAYKKHGGNRQAIFFGINVRHSISVAARLNSCGIRSAHIDAKTSDDNRDDLVKSFRSGRIQVLCNVGIITEGFDVPGCDCVIIGRPTKSRGMFMQMVGRATRPRDGKDDALIIDLAGVADDLGHPVNITGWNFDGWKMRDNQAIIDKLNGRGQSSVTVRHSEEHGKFIEVDPDAPIEWDRGVDWQALKNQRLLWRHIDKRTLDDLKRRARQSSDPMWALRKIAQTLGYKGFFIKCTIDEWRVDERQSIEQVDHLLAQAAQESWDVGLLWRKYLHLTCQISRTLGYCPDWLATRWQSRQSQLVATAASVAAPANR